MRVHVINLASATDRLAHSAQTLGSAGIAFERFDALDPGRVLAHPRFRQIPRMVHRNWTLGELGCLLSHYEVWRKIAANAEPFGAVLEDDLFIDPKLKSLLSEEVRIPSDADLIKLETTGIEVSISRMAHRHRNIRLHRLRSVHYGTGAYLLSRSAAGILADSLGAFDVPIDDALFSPGHAIGSQMTVYQVVPALAVQNVILADFDQRPLLSSELERERNVARELKQAMDASSYAEGRVAPGIKSVKRPTWPSALRPHVGRIKRGLLEKRMIIPFGFQPTAIRDIVAATSKPN